MSQRKTGALLRLVTLALNSCVGILFTPFLLRSLGQAEYGLYQLIGAFAGYLMLLDFGIQNTVIRFISQFQAKNDTRGEENFLAIIMATYLGIAGLICTIATVVYLNMSSIFGSTLSIEDIAKAKIMFAVLVGSLILFLIEKTFSGAIMGRERFVFANLKTLVLVIVKATSWVVVLSLGYGSVALVMVTGCVNLSMLIVSMVYCLCYLKVKIRFHYLDLSLFREIFGYSFFIFLSAIVTQINFRVGNIILGIMVDTSAVAVFALSMQLIQMFSNIAAVIPSIFFPAIARIITMEEPIEIVAGSLIQPMRYMLILLVPIVIAFGLFGKLFILLWAGPEYESAWLIALLVMVILLLPWLQELFTGVIRAQGRIAFQCLTFFIAGLINVGVSIVCVHWIGLNGAMIGTLLSFTVGHLLIMNWYYHFRVGLNIAHVYGEAFRGLWLVFVISSLFGGVNMCPLPTSWVVLVLKCLFFIGIYSIALWFVGINTAEKSMVHYYVKRIPVMNRFFLSK